MDYTILHKVILMGLHGIAFGQFPLFHGHVHRLSGLATFPTFRSFSPPAFIFRLFRSVTSEEEPRTVNREFLR